MSFRADKLFDLFNLQALVFVGGDACNGDRFAVHLEPN